MEHLDAMPSTSDKDDFFLKIWTNETVDQKEPQPPPATTAPITTADNVVGREVRIRLYLNDFKTNMFFSLGR